MRKLKIFITILTVYEFVMMIILHHANYCTSIFHTSFCEDRAYKYIFMCLMLPLIALVFFWWIPNIARLFYKKSCEVQSEHHKEMRYDVLHEIISHMDLERFLTAAIVTGIQRFSKNHPKTVAVFDDILKTMKKTKR